MKFKPEVDCSDALIVVLAGREWFVPVLAMRQNRTVIPRVIKVLPLIEATRDPESNAFVEMFSESTLDLMQTIVHAALTRAYEITPDELLDMPITPHELMGAMPVIVKQTKFFAERSDTPSAPGEAPAATQT